MGKRDTSYWVGICRNRHFICVPWDASDLRVSERWQKSSLLGKLFLSVFPHPKDTVSPNLKGGKCCVSFVVTAKLPYLTLPLRLVPFHQLLFCRRSCDARKAIMCFFYSWPWSKWEYFFLIYIINSRVWYLQAWIVRKICGCVVCGSDVLHHLWKEITRVSKARRERASERCSFM